MKLSVTINSKPFSIIIHLEFREVTFDLSEWYFSQTRHIIWLKSMFLLQVYLACCSAVRSQVQHLGELDVSVHLADAVAHLHTPLDGILFTFIASLKEVLQCLVLIKVLRCLVLLRTCYSAWFS